MLRKSSKYLVDHLECYRWSVNINLFSIPQHFQPSCHVFHFLLSPVKEKAKYVSNPHLSICVFPVYSTKSPLTWMCLIHWYSSNFSDTVYSKVDFRCLFVKDEIVCICIVVMTVIKSYYKKHQTEFTWTYT